MLGRQPEQGFERNMAVEAAIVTKNEFVEIGVEVPAAQPVIRAKAPSFQQCENSVNPWQDNMSRHFADHARIVPIVGQSWIGRVAIGDQGGSALHIGSDEGLDRSCGIVGDHGEANAARARIEIFCVPASRLGLIDVAIDHLDGANDEDFAGGAGLEECIAFAEGDFRLIDLDDSLRLIYLHLESGAGMPSVETNDFKSESAEFMHQPWRHRASLDANAGVIPRMSAHHSGDLFRCRKALAPPQPATSIVDDANGCHLLRNVQTDEVGHHD